MSFSGDIVALVSESENPLHAAAPWWERVPLGRLVNLLNGYPFDSKFFSDEEGERLIRIRDVTSGETTTFYQGPVPDGYWVDPGDLIVGMDGDFNLRIWNTASGLLNQRVCKLTPHPEILDRRFLAYALPGYLKLINEHTHSVTVKHLSSRTIMQIPFPLPPLAEQRRIAERLEELFERTRRARTDLLRVTPLTRRYLDAETRKAFDSEGRPGWITLPVRELAAIASGVTLGKRHRDDAALVERPYLRVANVQRGHLKLDDVKRIRVSPQDAERLELCTGDVLMNEGGDRDKLGRGWVWEGQIAGCIHQNHVFRLRLGDTRVTPRFLSRYANAIGATYFLDEGKQTTNLASISMAKVAALPVPVPPPGLAEEIDKQLDNAEAAGALITAEATRALALLDQLESRVLARAFQGELVAQDPGDEPPSVALNRSDVSAATRPRGRRVRAA